ncbi:hypothetical protein JTB14_012463 [Gonioctena quinquepunctata]|nr:hypothetical protein JTB14_012463 [Gonioctena quinquepunctata]
MDGKGENTVRKPRRAAAGVNKGLPDDFTWPRGFGVGGNGNVSRLSEAHSPGKTKNYVIPSVNSSKKSQVSLDLQKKRLFIQTEKDRQELERMKEDLEKIQKEIENRMKILQLEHELKEAELAAAADEENDDTNRSVSSKVSKIDKHSLVTDWIENVNVVKPVIDNHPQIVPTVGQPR